MKLSGVVVLYEPDDKVKTNIKSYIDVLDILYIYDNSSKSHEEWFNNKKIKYIFNGDNKGLAYCLNRACEESIKKGFKWILTMDQDTTFNGKAISELIKYLNNSDETKDGIVTVWHESNLDVERPSANIDYPLNEMTSGNFVNLAIYKKNGQFREDFFIDGIDIEYNLKLKKNGYRVVRLNNVSIDHELGNVTYHKFLWKTFLCTNHNYLRNYYMQRNYRYINEEYKDIAPEYCNKLIHIKQRIFKIIMFEDDKFRKIKYIFKGIRDYKKRKFGKLEE